MKNLQENIRRILREENEMETTLYNIFGEYPDEDELIWNYVGQLDFKKLKFPIKRVDIRDLVNKDFIENFKSNAESWQKKYVKHITKNIDKFNHIPIIVDFDNNIIIDGNHRLMGMYLSDVKYVYVVDINDTNLQESIRRILREELKSKFFRRRVPLDKVENLLRDYASQVFYETESYSQFKYELTLKAVEWIMWDEYKMGWDELPEQEEIEFVTEVSDMFEDKIKSLYNHYKKR